MLGLSVLTALVVTATACAAQVTGRWTHAAGELPEMYLVFEPDGKLVFRVGFEFWNPARWRFDSAAGELRITIPKLKADEGATFEEDATRGSIKAFDPKTKTVIYSFTDSTDVLTFAGLTYIRDSAREPRRAPGDAHGAGLLQH